MGANVPTSVESHLRKLLALIHFLLSEYAMCLFTWTAPFRDFHFINGDITRIRSSDYTFKCNLQTSVTGLGKVLYMKPNAPRKLRSHLG